MGETFGEEELIKKTVRNFSIKCVSTFADVYMLKKKVLIYILYIKRLFKEFDSRIMPNFLAMGSILAQIDIKERSRQKRINEFINKFQTITPKPLFSPKNHIKTSYKSELDLQLNETPQPKTPNNIQNFFFKSISNKNNNQDHEFSSPLEKFEKMSKHSPEPFLLKDFNVKDTLYPELSNIALQNRLRAVTAVKSPKKNEEMPRKQVKKRTFSEKMKKQGITLNISIPFIDFDIPFINTKNTIMDNKSSKIEPQNLKSPQEYKEKYINKAYHWEKNMKSSSSNSLLNTYLKKISSGNSIDLTQKYLSPNQSRIKTIFNGNWTKYQNVRKKKFFKNISEIQSFNFAKYEFPCAN